MEANCSFSKHLELRSDTLTTYNFQLSANMELLMIFSMSELESNSLSCAQPLASHMCVQENCDFGAAPRANFLWWPT